MSFFDVMTYSEKLRSPKWQKKRLEVMEHAQFRCQICGDKDTTLNVHHSYYTKGKEPWQYPLGSMICICEVCHLKIHPEKRKAERVQEETRSIPVFQPEQAPDFPFDQKLQAFIQSAVAERRPAIGMWVRSAAFTSGDDGTVTATFSEGKRIAKEYLEATGTHMAFLGGLASEFFGRSTQLVLVTKVKDGEASAFDRMRQLFEGK